MITAVILNWNTGDIAIESAKRLVKDVGRVILVDNGSEKTIPHLDDIRVIRLEKNLGNSISRNIGISESRGDVLLLDGDILYVPNSVKLLAEVLKNHEEAGCVGFDGLICSTKNRGDATEVADMVENLQVDSLICSIPEDQPIAWTQYGLFAEDVIKRCEFDESGYFGMPGYGFEDNDYYSQMKEIGYHSYCVSGIKYYHDQSSSKRFLAKYNQPTYFNERMKQFTAKWSGRE